MLYERIENSVQKNRSVNVLKIMSGFYTEVDQIIRDCQKTMKMAGQILILWNGVKNDLNINEYQRENKKKKIHR